MAKETVTASVATAEPESVKTYTKWGVFDTARRVPSEIICAAYKPVHLSDESCHTRLRLDANQMIAHVNADHSGAFRIVTREGDKPWSGWKELAASGAEIHDLRCECCDKTIPLTARHILEHCKPHRGKFRNSSNFAGTFNFTIKYDRPLESDDAESDE